MPPRWKFWRPDIGAMTGPRIAIPTALSSTAIATRDRGGMVHAVGGATMGTTWSASFVGRPGLARAPVHALLAAELDAIVAEMSNWQAASAVSRFNAAPAGRWQSLPSGFFYVLQAGLALARATDGAFDPTAGTLVDLWGFGPAPARLTPPSGAEIAAALATTGWQRITLDAPARRARQPGNTRLDLSGIAKGFAVDRLSFRLAEAGFPHHLVEIGGELRGAGVKPDGQPWWIAIEPPPGATGLPETRVALHGLSVATSGDYRRYFDHAARRYAHTIDPRTGRTVANAVASVTVLHAECMMADAVATALLVMGTVEGIAHATRNAIAAIFVTRTETGFSETPSPAFTALLG